jgi:hypothetical protein
MQPMKTTDNLILILSAVVILPFSSISANVSGSPAKEINTIVLAPSTPAEATFEEIPVIDFSPAPVTPEEADFNDGVPSTGEILINLAPVTPKEADFNDEVPEADADLLLLAPVTPAEADFSDIDEMPADISFLAPITPAEADFE